MSRGPHARRMPYLITGQVLGGIGVASGVAVGGLLAEQVSGTAALAGLAQTSSVLGGALLAVPMAHVAERRGRAPALTGGYLIALVGAVLVIIGAASRVMAFLLAGMMLFGAGSTVGLQARYAAIDDVGDDHRARTLSLVVWATTIGSVLGPNLSGLGGRLGTRAGIPALSGPFLFSITVFALAAAVAWRLPGGRRPLGHHDSPVSTRQALRTITSHPSALAGLSAMAGSHAAMVAVMVMTPVHLGHGGASLQLVGLVISLHIAGMYALSPLTGWLADRWGRHQTIMLGVVILLVSLLVTAGAGAHAHTRVAFGLTVLGLGWSACMVAGSALLSASVDAVVRPRVQGTGDLVMGMSAAIAGAAAGPILEHFGYSVLSLAAIALLVPTAVLVLGSHLGRRAEAAAPEDGDSVSGG